MKKAVGVIGLGFCFVLLMAASASAAPSFQCDRLLDDFNRPDSATLGPAWTEQSPSIGIQTGRRQIPYPARDWPRSTASVARKRAQPCSTTGTTTQYAAIDLGYADNANNVFVKLQNNGGGSSFNTAYF